MCLLYCLNFTLETIRFLIILTFQQNKSHEDRTIWCVLTASSSYYTGAIASRLRRAQGEFIVRAGQREVLKLHVTPQEYMDKLVDHSMVKVHAMAYVKQTRQAWSDEDDFPLHKPRMQVQVVNKYFLVGLVSNFYVFLYFVIIDVNVR